MDPLTIVLAACSSVLAAGLLVALARVKPPANPPVDAPLTPAQVLMDLERRVGVLEAQRGELQGAWAKTIEQLEDLADTVERKRRRAAASAAKADAAVSGSIPEQPGFLEEVPPAPGASREEMVAWGRRARRR